MSESEKQAARIKSRWWRVGQGAPRDSGKVCDECKAPDGAHANWCHGWATAPNNPNREDRK